MGLIKKPIIKPIKKLGYPVWFTDIYASSGKKIKMFMSSKKAKEYSLKTGKTVFIKLKGDEK